MDFHLGSGSGSGDEQEGSSSRRGNKNYHRHSAFQIQQLEAFFKECPNPDENQRKQLSRELGLEPRQVKFWFQNKRTQTKTQNERADNTVLRAENERIQCENLAIKEALKNVFCTTCGGPPMEDQETRQYNIENLKFENVLLREEHERVVNLLSKYIGRPASQLQSLSRIPGSPIDISRGSFPNQGMGSPASHDLDLATGHHIDPSLPFHLNAVSELEKSLMTETATSAMDELLRLLRINEPLWVKSRTNGKYILHGESYEKIFPKASHFRGNSARYESSKESCLVPVNGAHLVSMFLDPGKWVDLFPTIVTKAWTIHVLESGIFGNGSGSLQLMYEQMHILSPLVAPREFFILRSCQQTELGVWVIADVSYDWCKDNQSMASTRCWRLPSGCMIEDMPNGCSKVTWVEHVEVDDKSQTHRLYRDLISSGVAFGAERWIITLQRMCERFAYSMEETSPINEIEGVIVTPQGRRSLKRLAHRMVKEFCAILSMSGKTDFPNLSETNNSGVRVSIRNSMDSGKPGGMIVSAITSLWLPLAPQLVFEFFRDGKMRFQWDILSSGRSANEVVRISNGFLPGNCISILQPHSPTEEQMLILQESCIDHLGSIVVYSPLDLSTINLAIEGEDSSIIPVLPSGFIISGDGHPPDYPNASSSSSSPYESRKSGGSLLTVAFQILVCTPSSSQQLNMESVANVNTLISSTVQRIKAALNCSDFD